WDARKLRGTQSTLVGAGLPASDDLGDRWHHSSSTVSGSSSGSRSSSESSGKKSSGTRPRPKHRQQSSTSIIGANSGGAVRSPVPSHSGQSIIGITYLPVCRPPCQRL